MLTTGKAMTSVMGGVPCQNTDLTLNPHFWALWVGEISVPTQMPILKQSEASGAGPLCCLWSTALLKQRSREYAEPMAQLRFMPWKASSFCL